MTSQLWWLACRCFMLTVIAIFATHTNMLQADILNWETGEVIPGTEGLEPVSRGILHSGTHQKRNLQFADFSNQYIPEALFRFSDLSNARFVNANVDSAEFLRANLTGTTWDGANITGANFSRTVGLGFTEEQFRSTASFQNGSLRNTNLSQNNLSGWDFTGLDLDLAQFFEANLQDANFSKAELLGARLFRANWVTRPIRSESEKREPSSKQFCGGHFRAGTDTASEP